MIMSATNEASYEAIDDIITDILEDIEGKLTVSLDNVETSTKPDRIKVFNIFYVDSYTAFRRIFLRMLPTEFNYQGFYLIVVTERAPKPNGEMKMIMNDLWSLYIVNVNIIHASHFNSSISTMMTFFPYSSSHCEKVVPVVHNTFVVGQGFLEKTQHFPNKLVNLYGCPLSVVTFETPPFVILSKNDSNDTHGIKGIEGILIKVLAARMNFTLKRKVLTVILWGSLNKVGNHTGAIGMVTTRNGKRCLLFNKHTLDSLAFS